MEPLVRTASRSGGGAVSEEFMFRCGRLRGPLGEWCIKAHKISGEAHAMAMLIIFERKTP